MKTKLLHRLFAVILPLLLALPLTAQVPSLINYQGRLTDAQGNPVTGNRTMAIRIYNAPVGGNMTYGETIGAVAVGNGSYSFQFGASGNGIVSALSGQDYLALTVNGTEETTRTRLLAVPYALKSADAQVLAPQVSSLSGNLSTVQGQTSALSSNVTALGGNVSTLMSEFRVIGLSGNLAFGTLLSGSSAQRQFTLTNSGFGRLTVSGITMPTGFSGNWSGVLAPGATQNVTITFSPAAAQSYNGNISVSSDATGGNSTMAVSGAGQSPAPVFAPVNTSGLSRNGTAGTAFSYQITASNSPTSFGASGLPAGLTVNSTTGLISGTPSVAGNSSVMISATNAGGTGSATLSLTIAAAPVFAPVITSGLSRNGTAGTAFSYQITASNSPTSFGASGLPAGLTVNATTGLISGSPSVAGNSSVMISATNAGGTGSATLALSIAAAPAQSGNFVTVTGGTLRSNTLNGMVVSTFQIGKYEVRWDEWQEVRNWAVANGYSDLANVGAGSADNHPVRDVSWYDVVKWSNARSEMEGLTPVYLLSGHVYKTGQSVPLVNSSANGYRLPTEAEWEWAARGGVNSQGYTYSGSNDVNAVAWYRDNSSGSAVNLRDGRGTWSVGQKVENELGIHDMSGNVFEWCWDQVMEYTRRQILGASWYEGEDDCAVAYRSYGGDGIDADSNMNDVGFRLVRNAP